MLQWWTDVFSQAQQWLFEAVVQPVVFALGMGNLLEDAFSATGWLLVGLIQIAVMLALIAPLQRWRPVEAVTDRAAIRTEIWIEGKVVSFRARAIERDIVVLNNGRAELR